MTRKRLYKLLLSTGMQRNATAALLDLPARSDLTNEDVLHMLMMTVLPGRWLSNVTRHYHAAPVRYCGKIIAIRRGSAPHTMQIVTVMAEELQNSLPPQASYTIFGRGNGKTVLHRYETINQIAINILANLIDLGGNNNA